MYEGAYVMWQQKQQKKQHLTAAIETELQRVRKVDDKRQRREGRR